MISRTHKARTAIAIALLLGGVALLGGRLLAAPGDMVFQRKGEAEQGQTREGAGAFPPSIFPHWIHRIRYRCYVCHESLFDMKQGANTVTMDSIRAGEHCGACHNGRIAFNVEFQSCSKCHRLPDEQE